MTPSEFEYIKRAVQAIESGTLTDKEEIKVYRVAGQILLKSADKLEQKLVDNLVV